MFWAPCGSGEGAGGWGVSGGIWGHGGVSPHACTHMHAHVYMYRNCKWPPTWRHPCWSCLTCMCVFDNTWTNQDISILFKDLKSVKNFLPMGVCIVRWVGGWMGGLMGGVRSNHSKFKNCWLNQDNSILFDDLWFLETLPPMGGCGCVGGWVDGWINGWGQVKWLKI